MASKKISELSALDITDSDDFPDGAYIPVVIEGITKKLSLGSLLIKTLRKDKPAQISSVTAKSVINGNDLLMLEDVSSSNAKKSCTKSQFLLDVPQVETGSGAPAYTPSKKGMVYIDTDASDIYLAANNSSSADWKILPQVESGSGAPAFVPSRIGIIYINTAVGDIYISGATSSSSDWKKVN